MVLNKTNARMISAAYGDETDQWEDQEIIIFSMKVQFGDEIVDGIRVKIPTAKAKPAPKKPAPPPVEEDPQHADFDDAVSDIGDTF